DARADADLALDCAVRRIGADQRAVRSSYDQPSAGKKRSRIMDLAMLGLGSDELRQLGEPADLAVLPMDAQQFGIVGDDEDPVAGNPRRIDAGDIDFPQALAGENVEGDHAPALPDRDHLT